LYVLVETGESQSPPETRIDLQEKCFESLEIIGYLLAGSPLTRHTKAVNMNAKFPSEATFDTLTGYSEAERKYWKMKQKELIGKAQTVLGTINAENIGITTCHEHILWDITINFQEPTLASDRGMALQLLSLDNLWWVRANSHSNLDNMRQTDEQLAIKELLRFKYAGGSTVVELSQQGICRDHMGLARIARATGLNIIMGCGYYINKSHPKDMDQKTEEDIAAEIEKDILVGVNDSGIRSGIIGEIGCSVPFTKNEEKVLRACAIVQTRTGAAINVHPSNDDALVLKNIKTLKDAGADLTRVAISHVDGYGFTPETRRKILETGCYVEYDGFGQNLYHFHYMGRIANADSDIKRITDIMELIKEGYLNRILIAHDYCYKCNLTAFSGYGYAHILNNLLPFMRVKGMTEQQIKAILVDNPRTFLQFVPAK
jgi:phosphotriesterase-related protein